jgi:hypothetical protein
MRSMGETGRERGEAQGKGKKPTSKERKGLREIYRGKENRKGGLVKKNTVKSGQAIRTSRKRLGQHREKEEKTRDKGRGGQERLYGRGRDYRRNGKQKRRDKSQE